MKIDIDNYKLSDEEKQYMFDLVKKQMKKATYYKDAPAFDYLLQCRERVRFGIFAEKKEREIYLEIVKGNKKLKGKNG